MKHFAYLLPVCCLLFAACRKDSPATEIIPTPRSVKAGQGTFDLGGGIRIAPADPLLRPAARRLLRRQRVERGVPSASADAHHKRTAGGERQSCRQGTAP